MLGTKLVVTGDDSIQFSYKGSHKANKCLITLTERDDYTVEFWKIRGADFKNVQTIEGVYAEDLKSVFESETGLRLSL